MRPRDETEERPPVQAVVVVVPAHQEEALLGACLASVAVAATHVDLPVTVVTVLHRCTDGSREAALRVAAGHPQTRWIAMDSVAATVGAVRAEGTAAGLSAASGSACPLDTVWTAHTDADSTVPPNWLRVHVEHADRGLDLVLGSVEPEEDGTEATQLWHAQHHLVEGHTSIYAANLGVRASAYRAVGGFRDEEHSEDANLVHRLRWVPPERPWTSTDRARVRTSSRREGRADRGFATFLRRLDLTLEGVGDPELLERRLGEEVMRLALERGPDKSLCPSEAAGAVDPQHRRALTPVARAVACRLADEGRVVITQGPQVVDGRTAVGPVRIRLASS